MMYKYLQADVTGQATHQVIVTFHSYSNPLGRCAECNGATPGVPACCDAPSPVPLDQSCPTEEVCDTVLMYCYREVVPTGPTCDQPNIAPSILLNSNGSDSGLDVFGLSNPFTQDRSGSWQVSSFNFSC